MVREGDGRNLPGPCLSSAGGLVSPGQVVDDGVAVEGLGRPVADSYSMRDTHFIYSVILIGYIGVLMLQMRPVIAMLTRDCLKLAARILYKDMLDLL